MKTTYSIKANKKKKKHFEPEWLSVENINNAEESPFTLWATWIRLIISFFFYPNPIIIPEKTRLRKREKKMSIVH